MTIRCSFLIPLLGALALGCDSTGVGNPGPVKSVSLAIVADDDPQVSAVDAGDASVGATPEVLPRGSLEHAVLVLKGIHWLPCDRSIGAIDSKGPFLVDLVTGETRPQLPEVPVPDGGLCGFDAPLTPAENSAEVAGRSLFFSGKRADGVPFLLFANMQATLRVRAARGAAWGTDDQLLLLWAMQPRRWASLMELGAAQDFPWAGMRRIILIDVNRNPLLYAAIRARIAGFSGVFIDRDGDRFLDANERNQSPIGSGDANTAP